MKILTNFMNAPDELEVSRHTIELLKAESWHEFKRQLRCVDMVVINCGDALLYRTARHFLINPWAKKPLIAVDLVLRRPDTVRHRVTAAVKRVLLGQVTHFIHYFKDWSGYERHFGVAQSRSSYVPFKVNNRHLRDIAGALTEEYVFTMGRSLRDYDTFIRAIGRLPYPAAIPQFSFDDFEGKGANFPWNAGNIPANLKVLPDAGGRHDLIRNLARAKVVVIPTHSASLCASGLSTYLDAMYLEKCVVISEGPGASDLLTNEAILVPPHNEGALAEAIQRAWEDDQLRRTTAAAGRAYAESLGVEADLLQRVFAQSLAAVGVR
ncbi:MAG: glycosyltransferase [Proteobacteria bacterium]|nr:glycosyltransferase [Pseudomonadota bacterium]